MPNPNAGVFQKIREELVTANEHHTAGTQEIVQLRTTFEKMMDVEKQAKLDQLEAMRENTKESVSGAGLAGAGAEMGGTVKEKSGGLLGKLLGGGMMVAAAAGLAAIVAGIMAFMTLDVDSIIGNVKKLFTIGDLADGMGDAFEKGGKFFLIMSGLGAGLLVFGVGSAVAGASDKFIGMDVDSIKNNVIQLLSIGPEVEAGGGSFIGGGAKFLLAMTGLGMGLAVFGVGSAIAGMSDKLLDKFNGDFATSIKNNVLTLLSIGPEIEAKGGSFLGEGAKFLLAMTGIALGLAVFGGGSALAALSTGLDAGVAAMTGQGFAESIKQSVFTLLSIGTEIEAKGGSFIGESAGFLLAMTGLGLGLVAFSAGQAFSAVIGFFTGDQSQKVKDSVEKLLSIRDALGENPKAAAASFRDAMGYMGDALSGFAKSQADASWSSLKDNIMGFFGGGSQGPMDQLLKLGEKQEELFLAGMALDQLAEGLERISSLKLDGDYMSLNDFAEDMLKSVPAIETALMGGTVGEGWISSGTKIKGLASPDVDFEKAATNIKLIQAALKAEQTANATAYSNDAQATAAPPIINNITNNYYSGGGSNTTMIAPNASAVQDARKKLTR